MNKKKKIIFLILALFIVGDLIYIMNLNDKFCISIYEYDFNATNTTRELTEKKCFNNYFKARRYQKEINEKEDVKKYIQNTSFVDEIVSSWLSNISTSSSS